MKLKVKIAVAANPDGEWAAYGFRDGKSWDDVMDAFEAIDREQRFWIEAEIDVADQPPIVTADKVVAVK